VHSIRTLRAGGVVDVADSTRVACGASETSAACAQACCLTAVRGPRRSLAVAVDGVSAFRAGRVGDVAGSTSIASGAFETRATCAQACCLTAVRGPRRSLAVAVHCICALRAGRIDDVADSTGVACGASETSAACAQASCLTAVRTPRRSLAVAVDGVSALRAGGVVDVAGSTSIAGGAFETSAACAHACCLTAVRGP